MRSSSICISSNSNRKNTEHPARIFRSDVAWALVMRMTGNEKCYSLENEFDMNSTLFEKTNRADVVERKMCMDSMSEYID